MTEHYTRPQSSEKRREDPGLITGRTKFVDDIRLATERPAMLHMVVVRSPYAHARIEQIETEAALEADGVVAILTGQEISEVLPALEGLSLPGTSKAPRYPLAREKVRYVGDPVAVILARSRYQAIDARDLLDIDYTVLPAVTDVEQAALPAAPRLYEEFESNRAFSISKTSGDVDAIFQQAECTTRLRLVNQRLAPSSMENRACLFDYDATSGEFYAWTSSQAIYRVRDTLARSLKLPPERIHVRNAAVGGAFGAKNFLLGEELIAAWLAFKHGCPVKWIEERSENLQAQAQGRGQVNYLEVAFQKDGTLLGFKLRSLADLGGFLAGIASMIPNRSAEMLIGPYRVAAVEHRVDGFYTNKPPITPYRGAGRPEATYMLERSMDQIARELHMDPVEIRRKNFIAPDAFPHRTVTGLLYDSGNYPALLTRLVELSAYQRWRKEQSQRRAQNHPHLLGLGLATFTEISGDGMIPPPGAPRESALVRIQPDDSFLVQSGVSHNGQGHATIFAQITADVFGVPVDRVEVEINNTDLPVYSIGTFGSRVTQVGATAVLLAAEMVRDKALHIAAQLLEAASDDLVLANGSIMVRGVPGRALSLGEVAQQVAEHPELLATNNEPDHAPRIEGLAAWREFAPGGAAWSAGAHLALVEIDSETGNVEILRYTAVDDCGHVLNHTLAEGQLHGSLAQGIGQALYEETIYNEEGQVLSGSLMDYALPLAKELPSFTSEFIEIPSPTNPLGAKGVGESGTIGAPPAVVNAVLDALMPFGIAEIDMPLTREKVWALIHQQDAHRSI